MVGMRRGLKRFAGFWVGGAAVLVAVCGPSVGVAHGGVARGGVGDPVGRMGVGPAVGAVLTDTDVVGRPGAGGATVAPAAPGAEADLAYHGHVSLWAGRVGVWVEPSNHGPAAVPDATVRLRFSAPLDGTESLPPGCLRGSPETVLCSTGEMRAAGAGRPIALDLRVAGSPAEVVVNINTSWSGGAGDRNPGNNTHRVLAPATGDKYAY
ncbi:hypothetical protein GCM10010278_66940 [Streptomyces melanogenes]|nr:hypothetical protein GCM10010278_66940 [Streptomyces melanogenes]